VFEEALDSKVYEDLLALKVLPDKKDPWEGLDLKATKVNKDKWVHLVRLDHKDQLDQLVDKVQSDLLGFKVNRAQLVLWVLREIREIKVTKVKRVMMARLDHLDLKVDKDHKD